ncbi:sigma-70 family RNA polymerase sigma factor [Leifsonia shinshuensis]|uniref:RNA polymerase sigma factor n=1 Tax=Leifsonia shinshuensis TaxID=150026 RepID=UPI001F50CC76|nr:sigma-70 family RNA polymerase sigma factor [Leifsonia shinshuensis]MCI0158821.1 sigma-70 family RNA polymerase sigma factor [Leifsonia shinshuensis]
MGTFADEPDEAAEWAGACAGDSSAFAAVYDRHRERVFRAALRLTGDRHDAEDVTAAAFFELWRRRASVRVVGGSVLPWLLVVTSNAARNQARSVRRHRRLIDAIPRGVDDGAAAFEAVDDAVDHAGLARELREMPDRDRALLVLTALEGYSTVAAAEALGISAGAARVRLHRLRGRLREAHTRLQAPAAADELGGAR